MFVRAAIFASLLAATAPVLAQATAPAMPTQAAPVELKSGRVVRSSDGLRVGQIEHVIRGQSGAPVSASVIYNGRFVSIPAATLTTAGSAYVSSLSLADIRKLN